MQQNSERLVHAFSDVSGCLVAFSGGVDSAVVAQAAYLALGQRTMAVTAVSPSLARGEREAAADLAKRIGIRHREVYPAEIENADYASNPFNRCYFCKTELYGKLQPLLQELSWSTIVNGANADDLGDHRPGMQAAKEFQVRSPLAELGLSKDEVRSLARLWDLPVADKPAMPCLASRIAYGEEVTVERLERVDLAESWLRDRGLGDVRVRYHRGDLARLEVPLESLVRLLEAPFRESLTTEFQRLGFRFVTVDLQGRRSGSLNALVPLEQLLGQRPS